MMHNFLIFAGIYLAIGVLLIAGILLIHGWLGGTFRGLLLEAKKAPHLQGESMQNLAIGLALGVILKWPIIIFNSVCSILARP